MQPDVASNTSRSNKMARAGRGTTEAGIGAMQNDIYMHVRAQNKKQSMSSTAGISDKFLVTSKGKQSLGTPHERKTMRDELKGIHRQSVW